MVWRRLTFTGDKIFTRVILIEKNQLDIFDGGKEENVRDIRVAIIGGGMVVHACSHNRGTYSYVP